MGGEEEGSVATTPTWAVAAVCATMLVIALSMEHGLRMLEGFLARKKRKTLHLTLYQIQAELRSFGFMTLMLNTAQQPISKICITQNLGDSFLPCKDGHGLEPPDSKCKEGKVPLLSTRGTDQLLLLIFMLAVSRVLTCLITFGLAMAKVNGWGAWEKETLNLDYTLSTDPRRFKLAHQTPFGKRHLKWWSKYPPLIWTVCFFRYLFHVVSKADYCALRHSFVTAHFGEGYKFNFHKYLRRSLDHDFATVAGISQWSWLYAVLFILFKAHGLYSKWWMPIIPLLILLTVGTKLEVALTTMCIESSKQTAIVPGTLYVKPDNKYFWFGKEKYMLHLIHFILFQNSFQLAFYVWTWYKFGFPSCFHNGIKDVILGTAIGISIQFLCAYLTLPLYVLVTQMDSTLKEAILGDGLVQRLRNWRNTAKKNLAREKSNITTPTESYHSPRAFGRFLEEPISSDMQQPEQQMENENVEVVTTKKKDTGKAQTSKIAYDGEASFGMWQKQGSALSKRRETER